MIDGWAIPCEITLIYMSPDCTDDLSTLVQVMAWCRQATSHYLSQCWPRSLSPFGVTRPQWVNLAGPKQTNPLVADGRFKQLHCERIFVFSFNFNRTPFFKAQLALSQRIFSSWRRSVEAQFAWTNEEHQAFSQLRHWVIDDEVHWRILASADHNVMNRWSHPTQHPPPPPPSPTHHLPTNMAVSTMLINISVFIVIFVETFSVYHYCCCHHFH